MAPTPGRTRIAVRIGPDVWLEQVERLHAVNQRSAAGQPVEYVTYRGRDHLSVLRPGSRLVAFLLAWTQARFAGRAHQDACSVASR